MTLAAAVLVSMMALPCPRDEPAAERPEWLATVAGAIAAATDRATCTAQAEPCTRTYPGSREELAALLVTMGYRESGFRRRIARGECRPGECDSYVDQHGVQRFAALGMWQVHRTPLTPRTEWQAMRGDSAEHVARQARVAARLLGRGLAACGSVAGAMAYYGGAACLWAGTGKRGREQARIEREIRRAL